MCVTYVYAYNTCLPLCLSFQAQVHTAVWILKLWSHQAGDGQRFSK